MKKIFISLLTFIFLITPTFAKVDKTSSDYLKNKKHFAILNPPAECLAEKIIKKSLKKETGADFKVKFEGYTLSSMKQGIFKYLEISGKDIIVEDIHLPYVCFKTVSDYNWIDPTKNPPAMKSDMTFAYNLKLSEQSMNEALKNKEYQKTIQKVNKRAYPLFVINDVRIRIKHDKIHIIMGYNFPISPAKKDKTFMVSTKFKVDNGKILASEVGIDNAYGHLSLEKVTNLINLLDPLSFTLDLMNTRKCNGKIENISIVDNMVQVDGKIFVKGE